MNFNLEIGSKIVERGKVFTVYKIEGSSLLGNEKRIIYYKPHFEDETNNSLICSIPEDRLENANLRLPLSSKEMENIFEIIFSGSINMEIDTNDAKTVLNLNDPVKTIEVIVTFWNEKTQREDDGEVFPNSKKHVLELAIGCIVEEIALIKNISLETAEKRITKALTKGKLKH